MSPGTGIALAVAVLVAALMLVALLLPEKF